MKNNLIALLTISLIFFNVSAANAKKQDEYIDNVQTINNNVEAKLYAVKKTKYYTAVEIGFTNYSGEYVEFSPKEIFLDDEIKYSQPLLDMDQVREIQARKPSAAVFPLILGVGLGIASLATSKGNDDVAFGLGVAALGAGGAALITKGLEDRAKQNKFIAFENNSIASLKKIPPGMTLGGVLYFPPTKKPVSITLLTRSTRGGYDKKVFPLAKKGKSKY